MLGRREFFKAAAAAVLFGGTEAVAAPLVPFNVSQTVAEAGRRLFRVVDKKITEITWFDQKVGDRVFSCDTHGNLSAWTVIGPPEEFLIKGGSESFNCVSSKNQVFYEKAGENASFLMNPETGVIHAFRADGSVGPLKEFPFPALDPTPK